MLSVELAVSVVSIKQVKAHAIRHERITSTLGYFFNLPKFPKARI